MKLSLMILLLFVGLVGCGGGNSEVVPDTTAPAEELSAEELEVEQALE
jgi:hypothetical protein